MDLKGSQKESRRHSWVFPERVCLKTGGPAQWLGFVLDSLLTNPRMGTSTKRHQKRETHLNMFFFRALVGREAFHGLLSDHCPRFFPRFFNRVPNLNMFFRDILLGKPKQVFQGVLSDPVLNGRQMPGTWLHVFGALGTPYSKYPPFSVSILGETWFSMVNTDPFFRRGSTTETN